MSRRKPQGPGAGLPRKVRLDDVEHMLVQVFRKVKGGVGYAHGHRLMVRLAVANAHPDPAKEGDVLIDCGVGYVNPEGLPLELVDAMRQGCRQVPDGVQQSGPIDPLPDPEDEAQAAIDRMRKA